MKEGYAKGVPMGGIPKGLTAAPTFAVAAQKDPQGANLDRIQIIKGWVDAKGEPQEVYDVVWSGNRKLDGKGKLPAVGSTVDVKTATYANTIGSPELHRHPGPTRSSTRSSTRSTTCACWRSRRRGGPRTTPSGTTCRC